MARHRVRAMLVPALYLLAALVQTAMYHGRRMANCYAAYVPGPASLLMQLMPGFPDADSIRALQYFGIDHVLASSEWETSEHAAKVEQWKKWVVPELHTADMTIYRVVGAVPGRQSGADGH
ncbi:MAG TPA: hypothetical protein VEM57_09095 [Candidatus Binatus sp.]|nr:hypothetical protein [Candidatus Binatus sp.]